LNWWRKPLDKREAAYQQRNCTLQKSESFSGVYDEEISVDSSASDGPEGKRSEKVGSGLSMPPEMGSNNNHSGSGGAK
jgi:hypothetical protein